MVKTHLMSTPYRTAQEIVDMNLNTHVQVNKGLVVRIDYIKKFELTQVTFRDGTKAWVDDDCVIGVIEAIDIYQKRTHGRKR